MKNGFSGHTPVVMVGLGGTIMSRRSEADSGQQIIAPGGTLRYLAEQAYSELDSEDLALISEIRLVQARRLIDSSDLTMERLQKTLAHLASIREQCKARMVVLFGTDNMALMAEAVRQGLPPSPYPIIFTCSQGDIDDPQSDAVGNVRDALSVCLQPQMVQANNGVVGVQFDGVLRPAFGFIKKTTDKRNPFSSRGARIAEWSEGQREWKFPGPPWPPYFFSNGSQKHPELAKRVLQIRVTPAFDYHDFYYDMHERCKNTKRPLPDAVVLEAPGPGNLSSEEPKREIIRRVTDMLHKRGVPLVVMPQACGIQQTLDQTLFEREPVYAGNPITLCPDDPSKNPLHLPDVTANEGLACLALAAGEAKGKKPDEIIQHVRRRLMEYAYLVAGVVPGSATSPWPDMPGHGMGRPAVRHVGDPLSADDSDSDLPVPITPAQKTGLWNWLRREKH